jgi:transcriptional regulator with XRE-family HTH domain
MKKGGRGDAPTPEGKGGLKLPSLRLWRSRRGWTQRELSSAAGVRQDTISKLEVGRRGCRLRTARKLAEALDVDLEELQAAPEGAPAVPTFTHRFLHKAYLGRILDKEVGSSYAALDEDELERHCKHLSWEGVLEVVSARHRELEYLREELEDSELHLEVRRFYQDVVRRAPEQDIRVLATTRGRERSEKGKKALTQAMRELL